MPFRRNTGLIFYEKEGKRIQCVIKHSHPYNIKFKQKGKNKINKYVYLILVFLWRRKCSQIFYLRRQKPSLKRKKNRKFLNAEDSSISVRLVLDSYRFTKHARYLRCEWNNRCTNLTLLGKSIRVSFERSRRRTGRDLQEIMHELVGYLGYSVFFQAIDRRENEEKKKREYVHWRVDLVRSQVFHLENFSLSTKRRRRVGITC